MNDTSQDPACGEQCRVCGGRIEAEEGCLIAWGDIGAEEGSAADWAEEISAFVHNTCA